MQPLDADGLVQDVGGFVVGDDRHQHRQVVDRRLQSRSQVLEDA